MRREELERELLAQPVRGLQYMLRQLARRYARLPELAVDGIFGEQTLEAVMRLQRELQLPVTGVVDRITWNAIRDGWLKGWIARGWITSAKKPVKNRDLWERMAELLERHQVSFHWLKGHAGHKENERCDELARTESAKRDLPPDPGFSGV